MSQIIADLKQLIEPGIGIMLDFSQTATVEPACLKVFEFANTLAAERSASLGYMGESEEIREILEISSFFSTTVNAD
ncbi:hypothetical protein IQ266_18270 [filamentous cyanobacterium LEGE 11480]|uniref:STAS domain-containing protein n=1 Tax=Romeriopsis navalis LEGE 11480 TaxID=2777977 RepID=A0A928Z549_9CYAN|nr:hypothetical protein [Romeriopsis navalis]MBE9031682.1 hypothetical protein [Romeriopsis navalis LEGE 11480]